MPLINCKIELSLKWIENCILTINPNANNNINKATFTITDAELYVPIVTLKTEDNAKLSKLLSEGFKICMYWNKYQVIPKKIINIAIDGREYHLRELLDSNYQRVKILFVLAYNNSADDDGQVSIDSLKIYFFPRVKIENCNIEIDGRNFYDQPINDLIKQYDKIRKISTGQGDDYTIGCLLVDLSKQEALDADSRAIQQIISTGKITATQNNTRVIFYYILKQSKEKILEFSKGTTKVV